MMLAQLEHVSGEALKTWILIFAGVVVIVVQARELLGTKKRREISFEETLCNKKEFDNHVEWNRREHENLFSKIGGVERGVTDRISQKLVDIEHKVETSREKMHDRLNDVLSAVSELRGTVEEMKR